MVHCGRDDLSSSGVGRVERWVAENAGGRAVGAANAPIPTTHAEPLAAGTLLWLACSNLRPYQCIYLGPEAKLLMAATDSTPLLSVAVTETLYVVPAKRAVKLQLVEASSVAPAEGQLVV